MAVFEIPLTPEPQDFSVALGAVTYKLSFRWNNALNYWVLDISAEDGSGVIVAGIPLVTGADLLAQYKYLGIGGQLIVQTDHNTDAVPTFVNLGVTGHLYLVQ